MELTVKHGGGRKSLVLISLTSAPRSLEMSACLIARKLDEIRGATEKGKRLNARALGVCALTGPRLYPDPDRRIMSFDPDDEW